MLSIFKKKPTKVRDLNWLGVDLHSHLLPGIDDGCKTPTESVAFIKRLKAYGVEKFICTPHVLKELYPNSLATVWPSLNLLRDALATEKVEVSIAAAAEYMIDEDFEITADLMCLPGKFVLIEMSYLNEAPNIEQVIFDLQIKGYKVILAHPERYVFYHREQSRFRRLKEMGVLFQLNLLSVTGYYGKAVKQAADYILDRQLYDLAATDLHHAQHMDALAGAIENGSLFETLGQYPFLNRRLFL